MAAAEPPAAVLPTHSQQQVFSTPTGGPLLQAYITAQSTIFCFVAAAVLYGLGAAVTGTTARIPLVADAAEAQIR
jgi:hypothetical protein